MNLYCIDFRICGTAYVTAESLQAARDKLAQLDPLAIDVSDGSWFSRSDEVCLATAFTVTAPVEGQVPVKVSQGALRAAMRPSVRGEKSFWLPSKRRNLPAQSGNTYSLDILLAATAFVPAESKAVALEQFQAVNGLPVHMENSAIWFSPSGLHNPDLKMIFSPILSFVGPWPEPELYEVEDETGDPAEQPSPQAFNLATPVHTIREDAILESAACELMERFSGTSGRSRMSEEDALEIAALLKDFYEHQQAVA